MIRYLKSGMRPADAATGDAKVRAVVEEMLAGIGARGDAAVREYSERLDKWSPPSFRLSRAQIDACHAELSAQAIADIRFAQAQVRRFAEIQRAALQDVEV
jgi:sulfopropanediol 3-dehydrogenase